MHIALVFLNRPLALWTRLRISQYPEIYTTHITYQRLRKKKIIIKSLTLNFMRWPMHLTPGDWVVPWQGKTWAKYEI
jgi:hypothetical protein